LEFFGHWDRSEFRDRTFDLLITQPEIRLRIFLTPLSTLLRLLNSTAELGGMISAALTGKPKPTQKWTFNELDSEPVETHFDYGPFVDRTPNPLKGRGRNILPTGILSVRSIGVLASRLHAIGAGCKRLSSGHYGVQWLAVIMTA
jgi:hypothetical protein